MLDALRLHAAADLYCDVFARKSESASLCMTAT